LNTLRRAILYDARKIGKSLTLFLLFALVTVFITVSFSTVRAVRSAAASLRETVGASFTLRGKPLEFCTEGEDYTMRFAPIFQRDIDLVMESPEIKACNAQQTATAAARGFIFPSGMPFGAISANSSI